jgi:hypothetical protein
MAAGRRLALVGDPASCGVGRGGIFAELCATGRVQLLESLHRFTHLWEAVASLQLQRGDTHCVDARPHHPRPSHRQPLDAHLEWLATTWITQHQPVGPSLFIASTNEHVDASTGPSEPRGSAPRPTRRPRHPDRSRRSRDVGDVVATRRNDRHLLTTSGRPVRNRHTWTITAIDPRGRSP